jgi:hypothetical protein
MPFGFHLTMDTLPSGNCKDRLQARLGCFRLSLRARLGFSIPASSPGPRGITPAFGYGAPHSNARGTSTLLSNALLSAHYDPFRRPVPAATLSGVVRGATSTVLGLPQLPRPLSRHAVLTTRADRTGALVGCFPARAAFPVSQAGRPPRLHFRGLLKLHSRYGFAGSMIASASSSRPLPLR